MGPGHLAALSFALVSASFFSSSETGSCTTSVVPMQTTSSSSGISHASEADVQIDTDATAALVPCGLLPVPCGFLPVPCGFSPAPCGFLPVPCGFSPVPCGFSPLHNVLAKMPSGSATLSTISSFVASSACCESSPLCTRASSPPPPLPLQGLAVDCDEASDISSPSKCKACARFWRQYSTTSSQKWLSCRIPNIKKSGSRI